MVRAKREWARLLARFKVCDNTRQAGVSLPKKAFARLKNAGIKHIVQCRAALDLDFAESLLERVLAEAPDDVAALKQYARVAEKKKHADRRVERFRIRLLNLGFTERALADLHILTSDYANLYQRRAAARELALWYAKRRDESGAGQCLKMLKAALQGESSPAYRRQAAVMKAECFATLGNIEKARRTLSRALSAGPHADIYLAYANLEPAAEDRIDWINKALALHGLAEISFDPTKKGRAFDCLSPGKRKQADSGGEKPRVTVIIPAYNAASVISTALDSLLAQTWPNLEVLVADDCSTDDTAAVVDEYTTKDARVGLIRAKANGGPYVARNLALGAASGDFVTCHDADDWSHPELIETQVTHLLQNPGVVANTSQTARVTHGLKFYRRDRYGAIVYKNFPSLMFRREPVLEAVGYWDCVRFSADAEFIRRLKKYFGGEAVADLATGPLCFQRQHPGSLTADRLFGAEGYYTGARKEYYEAQRYFHDTAANLRYEFPQPSRPFAVPEPMLPAREVKGAARRHFEVIIASDFRLKGGTTASNAEEITVQRRLGLRTGLIQMACYDLNPKLAVSPIIRELLDGDRVQMLVYGEKVSCDLLVLRYPAVLQERQQFITDVEAGDVRVIMDQAPVSESGADAAANYDLRRCRRRLEEYFGEGGVWHPAGPLVRQALHEHHSRELTSITLAEADWLTAIDVNDVERHFHHAARLELLLGRDFPLTPGRED